MNPEKYLESLGIEYRKFEHEAVFTCEQARENETYKDVRGIHSKNLFLKDRKSRNFYLYTIAADKRADLAAVGEMVGEKVKFANPDDLMRYLKLTPGSVSPFGLLNDVEKKVKILIDKDVWESDYVSFHPNINTATLELKNEDYHKFIDSLGHEFEIV